MMFKLELLTVVATKSYTYWININKLEISMSLLIVYLNADKWCRIDEFFLKYDKAFKIREILML